MKKAFTLIELLGVIVILGIIGVIVVPLVSSMINDSKKDTYNMQVQAIKDAAKSYANANIYTLNCTTTCTNCACDPTLQKLIDDGYLEEISKPIVNPDNKKQYDKTSKVTIKQVGNKFQYIFPPA